MRTLTLMAKNDDHSRQVAARLSDEGYDGLHEFCARSGVTITGLLDALGRYMQENEMNTPTTRAIVELARQTDAERRTRGRS